MKAVLLLSGGIDSTVVAHELSNRGQLALAVGFDYGQPHVQELELAAATADGLGVPFLRQGLMQLYGEGPANVYPGRNGLMITHAAALALMAGADAVAIGCNADDAADYPDCRSGFLDSLDRAYSELGVRVLAPLLWMTKKQVIAQARSLGIDLERTRSCYGSGSACGTCAACQLRASSGA